jgi:hypothetical protein
VSFSRRILLYRAGSSRILRRFAITNEIPLVLKKSSSIRYNQCDSVLYQCREKTEKELDPEREPSEVKEDSTVYSQLWGEMKRWFQSQTCSFL